MASTPNSVTLYTDGACSMNPGPGGYGAVILYDDGRREELSAGYKMTTNNRMEIMGAIAALSHLPEPSQVLLYTDSRYMVDAMSKGWAKKWKAKGWQRNAKEKAKNPDLWETMLALCEKHQVTFQWVKAHAGNKENERCDRLAVAAYQNKPSLVDEGFGKF
ncbi:ribonuclease HI [Synechocystis sp. LEGE 06083]|uniref:ribonuclease HI n=1 Tax=Synechocystis sp. LEGE 06083 TaxID=915336 RepID=UPI00187F0498|nr:ribonuclease HI [Synechocystis sp. LEGE 06083]MBE9197087.1 ribonuclease HI [Synechocystis sp. LEGE 06083]